MDITSIDLAKMEMQSGYTSFHLPSCAGAVTVADCMNAGKNDQHNAGDDGFFDYGGGHFQRYAVDLGLGTKTSATLAEEISSKLNANFTIRHDEPVVAMGVETTPSNYAGFLRRILDGSLAIHNHLGEHAVCTLPSACPKAHGRPVPEAWHYSYGHWVEDDPSTGDGTLSSPGAYGFYPWISAKKDFYGIVARHAHSMKDLAGPQAHTAYWKSVLCGRAIRTALRAAR